MATIATIGPTFSRIHARECHEQFRDLRWAAPSFLRGYLCSMASVVYDQQGILQHLPPAPGQCMAAWQRAMCIKSLWLHWQHKFTHVTLNYPNFPAFTCWVGCPSSTLSFSFSLNLWVTISFGMSSLCSQHFWMPWPMAKPHQSRKTRPTFVKCGLDAKHGDEETTARRAADQRLTSHQSLDGSVDRISSSYGVLWKAATPHIT